MKIITCPCCLGTGEIEETHFSLFMTPLQRRIYQAVRNTPGGIGGPCLVETCYGDDPGGGPEFADKTIHVTIHNMNKRLAVVGEKIKANRPGPGAVYRLHRLTKGN